MKLIIFTSNALRHKFVSNSLLNEVDDAIIISECKKNDAVEIENSISPIDEHFKLRYEMEKKFFKGNDVFKGKTLPLLYKEVNLRYTFNVIKEFGPDLMLVFGSSIIKEPILSLLKSGRFINLHLGLSPYYRGSGTNFWPFVNEEIEYVGSTILHIDEGIDTGDIISHVRPVIEIGDDVHTLGCKVIKESVKELTKIINLVKSDKELPRVRQWNVENEKYYKANDFNKEILKKYKTNLENGLIENFLKNPKKPPKLVSL